MDGSQTDDATRAAALLALLSQPQMTCRALSHSLGVPRAAVKAALLRLKTDGLVAERAVPEGGTAKDQRGDPPAVEGDRQGIPAPTSCRHRLESRQPVPLATGTAALGIQSDKSWVIR